MTDAHTKPKHVCEELAEKEDALRAQARFF
jgi:hypothetical protein